MFKVNNKDTRSTPLVAANNAEQSQLTFICLKSTIEEIEKVVKYVQS